MHTLTTWTLQSPNATPFRFSVSNDGEVTIEDIAAYLTPPPVPAFPSETPGTVWTPSISNAGEVSLEDGSEQAGQVAAALKSPNGRTFVLVVTADGETQLQHVPVPTLTLTI